MLTKKIQIWETSGIESVRAALAAPFIFASQRLSPRNRPAAVEVLSCESSRRPSMPRRHEGHGPNLRGPPGVRALPRSCRSWRWTRPIRGAFISVEHAPSVVMPEPSTVTVLATNCDCCLYVEVPPMLMTVALCVGRC